MTPKRLTFEDYDMSPSPEQIRKIYDSGFSGVRPDPASRVWGRERIVSFYSAFPEAQGYGVGRVSLPFRACLTLDSGFGSDEAQTTGDCVSHAVRWSGMVDYCCDALYGETAYKGRLCTENIYGHRGHGGQGASCERLTQYVSQDGPGGYLVRGKYSDGGSRSVDLSVYNSSIGANWGNSGTPDWLNKLAAGNKALRVFSCTSVAMARDAIAMGFGVCRCSWMGFSSVRNTDGLAERTTRWSHAESWNGCDDSPWAHTKYGGTLFCEQNSWGLWNEGPKRHEQPDGSYWLRPEISSQMLSEGSVFIVASVRGYDRRLDYSMADFRDRCFAVGEGLSKLSIA